MGWTPLHAAAHHCPSEKAMPVAMLLLDAGAAFDAANSVSGCGLLLATILERE